MKISYNYATVNYLGQKLSVGDKRTKREAKEEMAGLILNHLNGMDTEDALEGLQMDQCFNTDSIKGQPSIWWKMFRKAKKTSLNAKIKRKEILLGRYPRICNQQLVRCANCN